MHNAPRVPHDRFYAMTDLMKIAHDAISNESWCAVDAVTQMAIWGNHSSTQFPDFYHAKINGQPVTNIIKDTQWLENDFISIVQKRGAAVIKARGASSAASAANAALGSVYSLTHNTAPNEVFSVALCSQGQYGVDEGIIFSYPCRVENGECRVVTGREHNEFAKQKLKLTLDELKAERDAVKELGLIK